jgi:hypothetical protein
MAEGGARQGVCGREGGGEGIMKGSSSCNCYRLEARAAYPKQVGEMLLTKEWRPLPIGYGQPPAGIRNDLMSSEAQQHGYIGYLTAKALQYIFLAENTHSFIGLEVRLVEYQGEFSHSFTPTGHEEIADTWYPNLKPKEAK